MKWVVRSIIAMSCLISAAVISNCGGGSSASRQAIPPLTISTAALPNGTSETPYSQTIQASGGVAPFTWTVSAGALPHNLALSSSVTNTVTISGTPDTAVQGAAFTIKVTDSANQSATQSYTVSILLEPDTLTLSPPSLSFAPQLIGAVSGAQAETVTNTGTSAVVISSIALTGTNAADFSQSSTCGSSLAAGANCTISVTFTPSQLGPRSASITITDNTVGSPHSVSLNGVGLTSGPNATLSATSLTFATQLVGTTSPAQSVTLSNYGTTTLSIAGIAATTNFGETDNCVPSVASAASCTINVTFTPSATGSLSGTLSVTDNAPSSPQTVSLSGTGMVVSGPNATLSPTSMLFACRNIIGDGCVCITMKTATLSDVGTTTLSITGIGITGAAFSETNNCDASLGAGKSCTITVRWTPPAGSFSLGAVSVSDNAPDSPQFVSLTGIKECSP